MSAQHSLAQLFHSFLPEGARLAALLSVLSAQLLDSNCTHVIWHGPVFSQLDRLESMYLRIAVVTQ